MPGPRYRLQRPAYDAMPEAERATLKSTIERIIHEVLLTGYSAHVAMRTAVVRTQTSPGIVADIYYANRELTRLVAMTAKYRGKAHAQKY